MSKTKTPRDLQKDKKTLRRVLSYIGPQKKQVVLSMLCAAVSVVSQLLVPIFSGHAIDEMIGAGQVRFDAVTAILLAIGGTILITALAQWWMATLNNRITFCVSRDLRNAAMSKLQRLPLKYLDGHPTGDLVSRLIADVDTFADGLLMGFTQLFTGVLTILGTLGFMLAVNWTVTLVVVVLTPLSLFVASFIARHTYRFFQEQTKVRGEETAMINEQIEGLRVVQAFGHEDQSCADFAEVNDRLQQVSLKAVFFSSLTNPSTRLVNNIVYACVALAGSLYTIAGGITVGTLSIFLSYASQYAKPFNEISGVVTELQNSLACAARVFELLLGDNLAGRKEHIAQHGAEYLDDLDVS